MENGSTVKTTLKLPGKKDFFTQEAFKTLRTNLQFCGQDICTVVITSCNENEGKTTITLQLAKSLAELDKRVLVIDADMRKSVMAGRNTTAENPAGLSEVLTGLTSVKECLYQTQYENLSIMFAGKYPPNPVELLSGQYFEELLKAAKESYDYVLIDVPPLGGVIDAAVVAAKCDGTILVISDNQVRYRQAIEVIEQLRKSESKILGVVRNNILNHKKNFSVDTLAEIICPYDELDSPYKVVNNIVYRLRRTLSVIGLDKLVIGKNGTFQINPNFNIHTDFDRFEDACIQLKTEENPDMRHSLYHSAIDMYKGQLLPRCEHELWLMQLSMYYQSLYLQITKGYVRLKMECKDYILAQKTAIDALRFDPKDSELNMYAILAMGFQGNLSMAQTYYTAAKPYLALEHAEIIKKYLHIK